MRKQKTAIYVKINANYTATVYKLSDLKEYCKSEGICPSSLEIEANYKAKGVEFCRNEELAKEVQAWIESFKKPIVIKKEYMGRKDTGYTKFSYITREHTKEYFRVYRYFVYTQGYKVIIDSTEGIAAIRRMAQSKWHKEQLLRASLKASQYEKKGYDY